MQVERNSFFRDTLADLHVLIALVPRYGINFLSTCVRVQKNMTLRQYYEKRKKLIPIFFVLGECGAILYISYGMTRSRGVKKFEDYKI